MTIATARWNLLCKLNDGHRLFELDSNQDEIAIADDSGTTPDLTDDGVLWLDRTRPLIVYSEEQPVSCAIPLRDQHGEATRTPTDAASILYLAARFDWAVKVGASLPTYRVISV